MDVFFCGKYCILCYKSGSIRILVILDLFFFVIDLIAAGRGSAFETCNNDFHSQLINF